jgi:hypothetical protein
MLRRAGLLNQREARDLERSTIAVRTTTFFYAGLALTGVILAVLLVGFGFGRYYATHLSSEPPLPPATDPALNVKNPTSTPDVHEAYQERMDRLLRELQEVSDQQMALEAQLTNKTTEAAEMASQTQLLRAQLRIKEREIQSLANKPEPEAGRKFSRGPTRYLPASSGTEAPKGFFASNKPRVKAAMVNPESPAEILIDVNPPDARPGNPYRLRLEIHNRGNASIQVTDLEVVWNYAGRNTGGPLRFSKRSVGPRSTTVLYEVDGVWMEELTAGSIAATVTLEGGDQLVNTLHWNEG